MPKGVTMTGGTEATIATAPPLRPLASNPALRSFHAHRPSPSRIVRRRGRPARLRLGGGSRDMDPTSTATTMEWVVKSRNARLNRLLALSALVIALASAHPSNAMTPEQLEAWVVANPSPGWTAVVFDPESIIFLRDHSCVPEGPYRRCWIRYELFFPSPTEFLSFVVLKDYDCAQRRTREVQSSTYSHHQGRGNSGETRPGYMVWKFEVPDTNGELMLNAVCREATLNR